MTYLKPFDVDNMSDEGSDNVSAGVSRPSGVKILGVYRKPELGLHNDSDMTRWYNVIQSDLRFHFVNADDRRGLSKGLNIIYWRKVGKRPDGFNDYLKEKVDSLGGNALLVELKGDRSPNFEEFRDTKDAILGYAYIGVYVLDE